MSIYNFGFPASQIQMQAMQPTAAPAFQPINYGMTPMAGQPLDLQVATPSQGNVFTDTLKNMFGGSDKEDGKRPAMPMMTGGIMSQPIPQAPGLLQMPQPMQQPMQQAQPQVSPYMQNLMQLASGRYG